MYENKKYLVKKQYILSKTDTNRDDTINERQ